jgi:hypothetical protein
VVRFDPASGSSATVLSFPSSEKVADAVPSPDGSRLALVSGDCAHSFFNFHLVVRDLRSGRQWALGADAAACHSLFSVAWSPNGSELVFPYGPSKLAPGNRFQPEGACGEPRPSALVVVSADRASGSASWRLIAADDGCSFRAATFDPWGIAAIEACAQGARPGTPSGVRLGDAYLVQLNRRHHEVLRLKLARGYDGGDIAADPLDHVVLVSEYQAANQGVPVFNWVWTFDGSRLRVVHRYPNNDAPTVTAEPWVTGDWGHEADIPTSGSRTQLTQRFTEAAGWSFSYPATMQLERSGAAMLASFSEVTVANFKQRRAVQSGRTRNGGFIHVNPPLDASGHFPADGVAFRMLLVEGGPAPDVTVPDSRFPISLATFRPGVFYRQAPDVPGSVLRPIDADGQHYTALAWIGPAASAQQRQALEAVIASLRFPRLHIGTIVGDELTVLQPATRYSVGSFTLIHAPRGPCGASTTCRSTNVPFYLVRAPGRLSGPNHMQPCYAAGACTPPGAFYAIGWTYEGIYGGYRSDCHLRLDRAHDQFYCTNIRARWDRVGRVIERPPGARVNDPLQFAFAKIAWDGHVVLFTGIDENPPSGAEVRALWPGWRPAG